MTNHQFAQAVRDKFGDRYTFIRTPKRVDLYGTTVVTCPVHGDIRVSVEYFLKFGCPKCNGMNSARKRRDRAKRDFYNRHAVESKAENAGKRPPDVLEHKPQRDELLKPNV